MGRKRKADTTTAAAAEEEKTDNKSGGASIPDDGLEPFKESVFVVDRTSFADSDLVDKVQQCLEELGADVQIPKTASVMTRLINSRAKYFVVGKSDMKAADFPKALAAKKDIKIVVADWIIESHKQAKNAEKPEYFLHPFADDGDAEAEADAEPEPPKKRQRKAAEKATAAAPAPAADDDDAKKDDDDDKMVDDGTKDGDEEKKTKLVVKGKAAVDSICTVATTSHVIEDGGIVFDCMLNQTNIAGNNNKFYVIQALEADGGGKFYSWTRWGRVGERGQFKLMPVGSKAAAIADFKKKFYEKTKNNWDAVKSGTPFTPVNGKYTMIEIDYGNDAEEEEKDTAKKDEKPKPEVESKLDKRVQDLIKLIFDMNMMETTMKELEFDCKKQPLGKLTKDQIKKGYEVLSEIEEAMKKKSSSNLLMELTNRFYTLIPHNFGRVRPPVINTQEMLKKKMSMLEALADIEIAAHIVEDTSKGDTELINQLDANYARLNTDIQPVDTGSDEYKLIEKYVKNSHPKQTPKIVNIYKIRRDSDEKRFETKKGLGNRMLLWHGSRLTNFVGILSQGLRIAPPEAPCSGYRFGKGIYFADLAQLSSNYCRSYGQKYFCMLLADVALGKTADLKRDQFMTKALPGSDSTKALGSIEPSPAENVVREDGVVVPCGPIVNNGNRDVSCFEHQYIVYDVAQCRLQYLIQFSN